MALPHQPPTEFTALKSRFHFLSSEHALKDVRRRVCERSTLTEFSVSPTQIYSYFVCPFNSIVIFLS